MKQMVEITCKVYHKEDSLKAIWKMYAYWAFLVGIAFFAVYPVCNWVSSLRNDIHHLYIDEELRIPFVPEFFWIYMSMFLLFFLPPFFLGVSQLALLGKRIIAGTLSSGLIYLILPTQLGFERIVPEGAYGKIYENLLSIDLPYNMMPSMHVVYSGFILLSIHASSQVESIRIIALIWLFLIYIATLLVHQHHLIDILSAMLIISLITSTIKGGSSAEKNYFYNLNNFRRSNKLGSKPK